jgi:uncharacterized protein (DUF1015 family)
VGKREYMFFSQPYKVVTTKERKIFLDMDNRYDFLNFTKASLSKFVGYDYGRLHLDLIEIRTHNISGDRH